MGFAIYQHELATGIRVSPHPESPSHLPPHSSPLGCPRAPALGALLHASNLHWSSILLKVKIHVSMLFSQIIPPSPSPTESKSLFFMSVSTPVFLPGESQGQRSLDGYSL